MVLSRLVFILSLFLLGYLFGFMETPFNTLDNSSYGFFNSFFDYNNSFFLIKFSGILLFLYSLDFYLLNIKSIGLKRFKFEKSLCNNVNKFKVLKVSRRLQHFILLLRATFVCFLMIVSLKIFMFTSLEAVHYDTLLNIIPELNFVTRTYELLIAFLIFDVLLTLFISNYKKVHFLFYINLFAFLVGIAVFNNIESLVWSVDRSNIRSFEYSFALLIVLSLITMIYHKEKSKNTGTKTKIIKFSRDLILPLLFAKVFIPTLFIMVITEGDVLNKVNEPVNVTINNQDVEYKLFIKTAFDNNFIEESFIETHQGIPFRLYGYSDLFLMQSKIELAQSDAINALSNVAISYYKIMKENKERFLSIKPERFEGSIRVEMTKNSLAITDLDNSIKILSLLIDYKYQDAADLLVFVLNDTLPDSNENIINTVELMEIFAFLSNEGIIRINLDSIKQEKQKNKLKEYIDMMKVKEGNDFYMEKESFDKIKTLFNY